MAPELPKRVVFDRFLGLLRCKRRNPGAAALTELISSLLYRVPFENVSKVYRLKRDGLRGLPGIERYLDGIERYSFGGTCYSNNYYLHLLLTHLGYDVSLCGADMNNPDVHIVNFVSVEGREYLIDVGYGAPFTEPLPRDLPHDYEIKLGADRYVLKPPDDHGRSRLEFYKDGEYKHGYTAKPIERTIEHFEPAITQSYRPEATFLNSLLIVRFFRDRMLRLHNLTLFDYSTRAACSRHLADREHLPAAVHEHFGIPSEIVAEVLATLGPLGDAWT